MEPTTLWITNAVAQLLDIGVEKFTGAGLEKIECLRQIVRTRLRDNPQAEQALIDFEAKIDLEKIKFYLESEMIQDKEFANKVTTLFSEIQYELASEIQDKRNIGANDDYIAQPRLTTTVLNDTSQANVHRIVVRPSIYRNKISSSHADETIWERGNKFLVLVAGGASLGGLLGQFPGMIAGGTIAAIYALCQFHASQNSQS
jgi:hypothetical protein